ncbi:MAG: hypothetical protein MJZ65_05790 [Paludibacteraceae bacterium]|nr:hypothetical protein [Paludibacteraceae bacterium]
MITLTSSLHQEPLEMPFALPQPFIDSHQVVAVQTGGTEQLFQQAVQQGTIRLQEPVYLVVSNHSNSLAAALEILSWVHQQGGSGRVISSPDDLPSASSALRRLGVIGQPSDWLIASHVDRQQVRERMQIELVDIPIEEVSQIGPVDGGLAGAERIYERLKELVKDYRLDGLTLRCFDLLSTLHNTGCMALSHLNDEGIPAACEGDIPLLLTMMAAKDKWGSIGFQVNPAEIHKDGKLLLAHCTVPLKMTRSHQLDTHFESGIGVGIHGELPEGDYYLMKMGGDLSSYLCETVHLYQNQYAPNLCRTQVWVQGSPELAERLLTHPIANHLLLVKKEK